MVNVMTTDKPTQAILEALKGVLGQPGEMRLFRSGKLPGVFPGRGGASAEAAAQALRDGLLEVTRSETKGKTTTEWVRFTPHAVDFVHRHQSPVQALSDLRDVLQITQQGIPGWMAELRNELQAVGERLTEQAEKIVHQIDALSSLVAEALRRAQTGTSEEAEQAAAIVPWGSRALAYLDKRKASDLAEPCPLPELFAALGEQQPPLTVVDFHAGLRRLQDRGLVRLLPAEKPDDLREPEYAFLDGSATYYHVVR
jgi:hypothetical protein